MSRQFGHFREPLFQVILDRLDVVIGDRFYFLDPQGPGFVKFREQPVEKGVGCSERAGNSANPAWPAMAWNQRTSTMMRR